MKTTTNNGALTETVYFLYWKGNFQFSTNSASKVKEEISSGLGLGLSTMEDFNLSTKLELDMNIKEFLNNN